MVSLRVCAGLLGAAKVGASPSFTRPAAYLRVEEDGDRTRNREMSP